MKIWPIVVSVLGISAALLLIGFVDKDNNRTVCNNVVISIDNQLDNHFVDNNDVRDLITNNNTEALEGTSFDQLKIRTLENRLLSNNYVETAQIFRDLKGNLLVNVALRRPQARIIQSDGPDAYVAEDGVILPVSDKFSSRVLLISGKGAKDLTTSENIEESGNEKLFELIKYINTNEFWKAQIAQVILETNDEVKLLPQVTKQYIEFGDLNNIEDKFNRLEVFYNQILPSKGWNSYSRVNVKYKNQIICE